MALYLAAPDFTYVAKPELDAAIASLEYHNFAVRRPILENGEAPKETSPNELHRYYDADIRLLRECAAVFAVPLGRDPGTLVEIGIAIQMGTPVITYDPRHENNNTLVMRGSAHYSADMDSCLSALFDCLSTLRRHQK
jgi:nucleoside 2-deoxyribosyltransferase